MAESLASLKGLINGILSVQEVRSYEAECCTVEALRWHFVHEHELERAEWVGPKLAGVERHSRAEKGGRGC